MLNLNSILLFSEKPEELADFYKKLLGKAPEWSEMEFKGFQIGSGFLTIGPHKKVKGKNQEPERMMFNLESENVEDDFSKFKKMGAKVIADPYHPGEDKKMTIATFADPDDNYFQLITPMDMSN
jgi:predicted enzyme related to lactoylglutathione lyase